MGREVCDVPHGGGDASDGRVMTREQTNGVAAAGVALPLSIPAPLSPVPVCFFLWWSGVPPASSLRCDVCRRAVAGGTKRRTLLGVGGRSARASARARARRRTERARVLACAGVCCCGCESGATPHVVVLDLAPAPKHYFPRRLSLYLGSGL